MEHEADRDYNNLGHTSVSNWRDQSRFEFHSHSDRQFVNTFFDHHPICRPFYSIAHPNAISNRNLGNTKSPGNNLEHKNEIRLLLESRLDLDFVANFLEKIKTYIAILNFLKIINYYVPKRKVYLQTNSMLGIR